MYINLTQMTENLQWLFLSISEQLFWPTLLESKWCLQIPLRRFITCVMTDRGRKNLQVLSCTQSTCSSQLTTLLFTSNRIAKHSFRFYTFTLKSSSGKSCNISFSWNQMACCIRFSWTLNDASLTLQRKEYHFILKCNARITLRINKCAGMTRKVYTPASGRSEANLIIKG